MKTIIDIARRSSVMELVLFAAVACMALTAGYASLMTKTTVSYGDITGSTHASAKVAPMTTMQAMPGPVDTQH
jgi:hypothetical protein